jgi:subtilisin
MFRRDTVSPRREVRGRCVVSVWIGLLVVVAVCGAPTEAARSREKVLVGFDARPNIAAVEALNGRVKYVYRLVPAIAAEVPRSMIPALRRARGVAYVEPDYPVYATGLWASAPLTGERTVGEPTALFDPALESLPWGIERIGAPDVWLGVEGQTPPNVGEGIRVGIIDTGIDYTHPDLADNYVLGYDFVNRDWDPADDNGHGTHVAGIVAAIDDGPNSGGGNTAGISVVGAAPRVSLYIAKSLNADGVGSMSDIVAALDVAASYDVDVVNMSLGSPFWSRTLRRACDNAYAAGVLLVAAAGNEGLGRLDIPARYWSVIGVGATDELDRRASFSNYGQGLELCAPGVGVLSGMPTYEVALNRFPYEYEEVYDYLSGTSMASPHVAGTAALVLAAHPDWTHAQVRERLASTAEDLGPPGTDTYFGYGLVDAAAAAMD